MNGAKVLLFAAYFLLIAHPAFADSVIVATDLSQVSHAGAGLCPSNSNCEVLAQEFTLLDPVVIDVIEVQMSGPASLVASPGTFTLELDNPLGTPIDSIGSGTLTYVSDNYATQLFSFDNLDILLNPGNYYLELDGGDIAVDYAPSVVTAFATVGSAFSCDPTVTNCSNPTQWGNLPSQDTVAMQIDGTPVTPEPSSWLLVGTSLLAACTVRFRSLVKLPAR